MQEFEIEYAELIREIVTDGTRKQTRNGETKSVFGRSLHVDLTHNNFPIVQGRKIFTKGVLGELAAMLRRPTHIDDFRNWGCNYWDKWAKPDGSINVDYGNAWFDFEGYNQIEALREALRNNPNDRRMIISGWRPHKLKDLDLPCCHYSYQFYVANDTLSMIWTQRSVDMMIGLPSDIVFAAAWLIAITHEFGYKPGTIKFDLGDCHVYAEHYTASYNYIYNVLEAPDRNLDAPKYFYNAPELMPFTLFTPACLEFNNYGTYPAMKLELKE